MRKTWAFCFLFFFLVFGLLFIFYFFRFYWGQPWWLSAWVLNQIWVWILGLVLTNAIKLSYCESVSPPVILKVKSALQGCCRTKYKRCLSPKTACRQKYPHYIFILGNKGRFSLKDHDIYPQRTLHVFYEICVYKLSKCINFNVCY